MPTYDYRCERCHERFELWQSFSDDTLVTCPLTGGPAACEAPGAGPVKKVFSKVGISFKGDGFYKTDHGTGAAARADRSAPVSAGSEPSDGKSSDTKKSEGSKSSEVSKSDGAAKKPADTPVAKSKSESKSASSSGD